MDHVLADLIPRTHLGIVRSGQRRPESIHDQYVVGVVRIGQHVERNVVDLGHHVMRSLERLGEVGRPTEAKVAILHPSRRGGAEHLELGGIVTNELHHLSELLLVRCDARFALRYSLVHELLIAFACRPHPGTAQPIDVVQASIEHHHFAFVGKRLGEVVELALHMRKGPEQSPSNVDKTRPNIGHVGLAKQKVKG